MASSCLFRWLFTCQSLAVNARNRAKTTKFKSGFLETPVILMPDCWPICWATSILGREFRGCGSFRTSQSQQPLLNLSCCRCLSFLVLEPKRCLRMPESAWTCLKVPNSSARKGLILLENQRSRPGKPNQRGPKRKVHEFRAFFLVNSGVFFLRKTSTIHISNFCSGMPLWKVHELTFLFFGFAGATPEKMPDVALCPKIYLFAKWR